MTQFALDMYLTAGIGVLALMLGMFLTRKITFLKKFCIPAPVSGGIIISLLALALYEWFNVEVSFDSTIKDITMLIFFTSVGFQSDFSILKKGGRPLLMMVLLVAVLIVLQNAAAVGISSALGQSPLLGMAAGSIPMSGGHGTAGGFSPLLESLGLTSATSVTMAAATFGLVAGSIIGGPLAELLIRRKHLSAETQDKDVMTGIEVHDASPEARQKHIDSDENEFRRFSKAMFQIIIAMALGTLMSKALALTGITFPTYFGALIAASLMRNVGNLAPKMIQLEMGKIVSIGNVSLSLFLGMAMVTMRLWELADLALPLMTILFAQVLLVALFSVFAAFPLLGRDYDAAVLVSGLCGFGLGATPNAMANMSAVCYKYSYAVKPFVIVPIIGAMFVDIINTGIVTLFLNFM